MVDHFVTFKFGDVELLDTLNFFEGARSLDFFFKANKTSETKKNFPDEWFNDPEKLKNTELPRYEKCFSKLRNQNPLEKTIHTFKV